MKSAVMQAALCADDGLFFSAALRKRLSQGQHKVGPSNPEITVARSWQRPRPSRSDPPRPQDAWKKQGSNLEALLPAKARDAVVIILTAYGTVEEAVEAMKLGAYNFIIKTVDLNW
jgi:two-component system response regulator AtoC